MKKKNVKNKDDGMWAKGAFAETLDSREAKEKMKTFHKKHDEDMNFNCRQCNKKISAHNKDWHDGMCDDCFNNKYFPEDSPDKDPLSEVNSNGRCRLCSHDFSGKEIKKHIKECAANQKEGVHSILMKASSGPFWVYFSVPSNNKLTKVDQFLRDLWLECCGHLSAFTIEKRRYLSSKEGLEEDEESMDIGMDMILKPGLKFQYEYDFGTETVLEIEYTSKIQADKNKIKILARNNLPDFRCGECEAKAEQVCVQCIWGGEGFVCKKCLKSHKCIEPCFLPVVNSPRMGMCGFTGEECGLLEK